MLYMSFTPQLLSRVAGLLIASILIRLMYSYLTHPLRKFPGPLLCKFTNAPYSWYFLRGRQSFSILRLHRIYGPVVRIAPNELSFNTAQSWKDIYGFRPGHSTFLKSAFYDGSSTFDGKAHGIIASQDPAEHAHMRRYLSFAFSAQALREQESLVAEIVDALVQKMMEVGAGRGEEMDMERWLRMCTFDITGSLAFGKSFDALMNGGQHPSVRFIHEALKQMSVLDTMRRFPYLGKIFALFFAPKLYSLLKGNKIHEEFALQTIRERLANPSKRPDFLTRLQGNLDPSSSQPTDIQIAAHAADLLQAGSDTSNTAIYAVLYYLLKSPSLYSRLTSTIRQHFFSYKTINSQEASRIPFLKCVVLEAMRIYAPVPTGLSRVVPKGGDTIDGQFVPGGTWVSTNSLAASLSPKNFYEPYAFKPERWSRLDSEDRGDVLDASQPFSLGPRGCIGQNLAWMEMNMIICKILWSFDLELVNKDLDLHRDTRMNSLWESPPLWVKVRERTTILGQ